jgi:hypothetical protein
MNDQPEYSFSFEGEDRIISSLFREVQVGTYIDIGCNHPVVNSNTYLLYCQGWRGLAVDANSEYRPLWSLKRPDDIFISALLSDSQEHRSFSLFSDRTMSSCDPETVSRYSARLGAPHSVIDLSATTLGDLLQEVRMTNKMYLDEIHLVSLDVEGEDLNVLKGHDFLSMRPGCIVVETKGLSLSNPRILPI